MDENLLSLLEELSLRSCSEDETYPRANGAGSSSNHTQYSSSNVSSPNYDQLTNCVSDEDVELKNAVTSLFHDLRPNNGDSTTVQVPANGGYDKSKLLVALLGNVDLVTCAVKKINQLVSLGKKMEQIYRCYYRDPNVELDLNKISQLIDAFTSIYNSESYVREVNVSRVYQAYCIKLLDIYENRMAQCNNVQDVSMIP